MAEKVKIKIEPSGAASENLTVADAMRQVLDYIQLLELADSSTGQDKVVWRLHSATTNSPFEVVAEATAVDPTISVAFEAARAKRKVRDVIKSITDDEMVPDWVSSERAPVLERVFKRNQNGIGKTTLDIETDSLPVTVTHSEARVASLLLQQHAISRELSTIDYSRTEYGSVEGEVIETGTYYNKPSITLRERLTKRKVKCVLEQSAADKIGPSHSWSETWTARRIIVTGSLHYDSDGYLSKIDVVDVTSVEPQKVNLAEVQSIDILKGKTPLEFLKKSWGADD